ncbi:J domain-containing protein [Actinomadura sp. WMMA1423]|uniref:J domain-containing protein n=1 Tax=Actinomadura sp. WMMA1423 TaxID=2591108 RepID=UPI00197ADEA6|nr:J domain-containing protein [Actinomadura sp. WMMA1423]
MKNDEPDYYELLGVERTATAEEITRAYRRAMRAVHPDASGTSGLFRLVKAAYDTLKDPAARAAYDARGGRVPPEPPRSRPEPEPAPEPEPPPRPGAGAGAGAGTRREGPADGRSSGPGPSFTKPQQAAPGAPPPSSPPRVRPRFGAHWIQVAAVAVWSVVFVAAVYALWPSGLPVGFLLLLVLPLVAMPLIALEATLRSLSWLWAVCVLTFAGGAALAANEADGGGFWTLCAALVGLAAGAAGLAAAPHLVRKGRELDRLIAPDSLDYQIFNVPGAGLDGDVARQVVARESASGLERLAQLDGVRIVHALTAPQPSGQAPHYVEHVLLRGDRLAVVMARRWPAGTYAWTSKGTLTTVGRPFPRGDTGIGAAVKELRRVVPRGVRVRGFVAVLPDDPARSPRVKFPEPEHGDLLAGDLEQVRERIAAWLAESDPVVDRRLLAALLPHLRHP